MDNRPQLGKAIDDVYDVGFHDGFERGVDAERERIALLLAAIDDTWGIMRLDDLFERRKDVEPHLEKREQQDGET